VSGHKPPEPDVLGVPLDLERARRDRLAAEGVFGADRVFDEATVALLAEVPAGACVLEVGAATGVLTRPLLERAGHVTAMEISAGMLARLLETDVASSPKLTTLQGIVEDLPASRDFDCAVVTFTPRRGLALAYLLEELAARVTDRVVMLLEDDTSLDWAYLARYASADGFDVRMRVVSDETGERRAVVLVADVANRAVREAPADWGLDAREIVLGSPVPRGTSVRLVRQFLAMGDRAMRVRVPRQNMERLWGNLRTAAHREGGEVAVHRQGDELLLVRMPLAGTGRGRPTPVEWE
jgi:SAM-dependent methyltransferase